MRPSMDFFFQASPELLKSNVRHFLITKVLLHLITRLSNSLQNPGLRIYTAVHENPKERNLSLTLRDKRVDLWYMATYNALFALFPLLAFCACLT